MVFEYLEAVPILNSHTDISFINVFQSLVSFEHSIDRFPSGREVKASVVENNEFLLKIPKLNHNHRTIES